MAKIQEVRQEHEHGDRSQVVDRATGPEPQQAFGIGLLVGAVVAVAVVIFILQNTDPLNLNWLWFDWSMPRWIVIVGCIAIGYAGYPLSRYMVHRLRDTRERRRSAAEQLRREVGR